MPRIRFLLHAQRLRQQMLGSMKFKQYAAPSRTCTDAYLVVNGFLDHALGNLTLVGIAKNHDFGELWLSVAFAGKLVLGYRGTGAKGFVQLLLFLQDLHWNYGM